MATSRVRSPGGPSLSTRYGLDGKVASSYSHVEGTWFGIPTDYPAAFWDPYGYAIFSTKDELEVWADVKEKVNFNKNQPISSLPFYVRVTSSPLW